MPGKAFEYLVMHHSKPTKAEEEQGKKPTSTIVAGPKLIVAADDQKAAILAYREIPGEYVDGKLDEIEVIVRPF